MFIANMVIVIISLILIAFYFSLYRTVKGKIFKHLLPNLNKVNAIHYDTSSCQINLEKHGEKWIVTDSDWEADKHKVYELINKLRNILVQERIRNPEDKSKYNIGKGGVITLTYPKKTIEITIGDYLPDDMEHIYVMVTGDPDVLVVTANSVKLNYDPVEYCDSYIFSANYEQVESIEGNFGIDSFSLIKTDDGWLYEGKYFVEELTGREFVSNILSYETDGYSQEDIKLPKKPEVVLTVKIKGRGVSRYFFNLEGYAESYIMPLSSRMFFIRKSIIDNIYKSSIKIFKIEENDNNS